MIPFLRHLFLENFFLKLFSLSLAVVVWLIVAFASQKEIAVTPRVFTEVPIKVLSSTEDVRSFKVSPDTAEVTVQASAATLQNLHSKDIQALVDLTGVATARGLRKRVEVTVPAGVALVRVVPEDVLVLFPPTEH
jgi:YbbR domain-containing protein